jgi:hypothetical protein
MKKTNFFIKENLKRIIRKIDKTIPIDETAKINDSIGTIFKKVFKKVFNNDPTLFFDKNSEYNYTFNAYFFKAGRRSLNDLLNLYDFFVVLLLIEIFFFVDIQTFEYLILLTSYLLSRYFICLIDTAIRYRGKKVQEEQVMINRIGKKFRMAERLKQIDNYKKAGKIYITLYFYRSGSMSAHNRKLVRIDQDLVRKVIKKKVLKFNKNSLVYKAYKLRKKWRKEERKKKFLKNLYQTWIDKLEELETKKNFKKKKIKPFFFDLTCFFSFLKNLFQRFFKK